MKFSLLQPDLLAGDLSGNARKIVEHVKAEQAKRTNLCIFPELALTGYVACDYLRYPAFLEQAAKLVDDICVKLSHCDCAVIFGGIGLAENGHIFNRAWLIQRGRILGLSDKKNLESHEKPYFSSGSGPKIMEACHKKYFLAIGKDLASLSGENITSNTDLIVNIAADAFILEDRNKKLDEMGAIVRQEHKQGCYVNAAGACDGTIFAGGSFWIDCKGEKCCAVPFEQDTVCIDLDSKQTLSPLRNENEQELLYKALLCGIQDYCHKTGQKRIVLGLSGGMDSALVAVLACRAINAEHVTGLLMPSPWSSEHSVADALALASNLGMKTVMLPIEAAMQAYDSILAASFAGLAKDVTEENLQARIRGMLVMAFANKFGGIALATGNKSEIAVGYCTLYGDTCGALEPIGDLYKTEVYELARWINLTSRQLIPENILAKAPSAELRPGQKDADSLPPYDLLDSILKGLLDKRQGVAELIAQGLPEDTVKKVAKLVAKAQFKRIQTAPILQVHIPTFLKMPVAGRFPFTMQDSDE